MNEEQEIGTAPKDRWIIASSNLLPDISNLRVRWVFGIGWVDENEILWTQLTHWKPE